MTNYYIEALKMWNKETNKGTFCIPKKGTVDYITIIEMKMAMEKQELEKMKKKKAN